MVDKEGNAVAVTTTLNNAWGSDVTSGSLGFLLNDEMDDFATKIGVPGRSSAKAESLQNQRQ